MLSEQRGGASSPDTRSFAREEVPDSSQPEPRGTEDKEG